MHASVEGVYNEYVGILDTFIISKIERGTEGSMGKGFSKTLKIPQFIEILYTLRAELPSLTKLQTPVITFSRITPNIEKIKSKLQQLLDGRKPLILSKTELESRLQR